MNPRQAWIRRHGKSRGSVKDATASSSPEIIVSVDLPNPALIPQSQVDKAMATRLRSMDVDIRKALQRRPEL